MLDPGPRKDDILRDAEVMRELEAFSRGRCKTELVNRYIELPSAKFFTQIAASKKFGSKVKAGPSDAVKSAVELFQNAESHLLGIREGLVAQMNRETLLEVARRLKLKSVDDWYSLKSSLGRLDSVSLPLANRLIKFESMLDAIREHSFSILKPKEDLKATSQRTSLPRPDLECRLVDALRWATNSKRAGAKALVDAYDECILMHVAKDFEDFRDEGWDLDSLAEIADYANNFVPKSAVPEGLEIYAISFSLNNSWTDKVVISEGKLAWICRFFEPFWRKYGGSFKSRRSQTSQRSLRAVRRSAGTVGFTERENRRYAKICADFIAYLGKKAIPSENESRELLLLKFVEEKLGIKTRKAQFNVVNFLETFYLHKEERPIAILGRLHDLKLSEFESLDPKKRKKIKDGMSSHEKRQISRRETPKSLLTGWRFSESGIEACLEILTPVLR